MQNVSLVYSVDDNSLSDDQEASGVLKSDFFPVTAGVPTITIAELIGVTIVGLWREDAPWEQISGTLEDKTYHFDDTTGGFEFFTNFNSNEKLFVLWYTGTAPVTYNEPVTMEEMKAYMRLQGFTGDDGILSEFDYDNELIGEMITAARETIEKHCAISIVTKSLKAVITNEPGNLEIPYGPVSAVSSLKDSDGKDILSDLKLLGSKFPIMDQPRKCKMTIEYVAGYNVVPKTLKIAIMKQVCWDYEHRGNESKEELCPDAYYRTRKFCRQSWL